MMTNSIHQQTTSTTLFLLLFCTTWMFGMSFTTPLSRPIASQAVVDMQILQHQSYDNKGMTQLYSSFYGKFDEDDDEEDEDEDEDDDDDYDDLDDMDVANFRSKMSAMFGSDDDDDNKKDTEGGSVDELINFARSTSSSASMKMEEEWASSVTSLNELRPGCILLANPEKFCSGPFTSPNPSLLRKFGLTLPPPADLGPDRQADLLPVLMVVEQQKASNAFRAVLLNRRTGYLLGDLEQQQRNNNEAAPAPILEKFCIQPLWFGGVDNVGPGGSTSSVGLEMLHICPVVQGAEQLTEDGLYWGGDPAQAQEATDTYTTPDGNPITGFDFKFFVQSTVLTEAELKTYFNEQTFFAAQVAKEVLFKSRDRMGTRRAKPLWTEIMELLGGEYGKAKQKLYNENDD